MQKIKKDTKFIDVLKHFESCLDNDIFLYDKDKFNNLKYSIEKMKDYLKEYSNQNKEYEFKRYSFAFKSYYSFTEDPYDIMLMSQLNKIFDLYLFEKKHYYNSLGLDLEKITRLVKNPEKDIINYDEVVDNNLDVKIEKYNSIRLSELINGDLLKCKVSENQSLIIKDDLEDKDLILNSGEEFFVFARKGSFTIHHHHSNVSLINNDGESLKTINIQCFIITKDISTSKNKIINCKSNPEDLLEFQSFFYYNYINVEIPLNWLKQVVVCKEINEKKLYIPIGIGSNDCSKDILFAKINNNKDEELLIRLMNNKKLNEEELKYILCENVEYSIYIKEISEDIKDFILEQKKFSNQNQKIYQRLKLSQTDYRDSLFLSENIGLKYLREISYKPSEKIIKQYLNKNGLELQYVEKQNEELCLLAVKNKGTALRFVKEQTLQICQAAVLTDPKAIKYVDEKYKKNIELKEKSIKRVKI